MASRPSSFLITWINLLTTILSLGVISIGIWLTTKHGDCEKFLTTPVFIIGGCVFIISLLGFIGAWKESSCLLWIYLAVMFLLLCVIAVFTIFAFVVTNSGAGHIVSGQGYKEYRFGDYSHWLQRRMSNPQNWMHLRSCLVRSQYCSNLQKSVDQLKETEVNSVESGCCRPPTECGYPMLNSSFFDLHPPLSPDTDCLTYENDPGEKCFGCNSCKAGVAQFIKQKWRTVAIFNILVFLMLSVFYSVGCCARRGVSVASYSKV
ncbi:hypothetical protein O6H91_04G069900 [Diphasiastrum complanatum]|uniref:Uncharacterized protein n=1 Tax=Diphasiastrum complanatum TaxID=34168 RepID=A0ACC2DXW8_DIPCM|nr:hypothetical protein O6H91_04G069900 [Diphasiastrum complanatum]